MPTQSLRSIRAQVVTVSDSRTAKEREDTVGPMLVSRLAAQGAQVGDPVLVPDEKNRIAELLIGLVDDNNVDLVVTTGGTGFTPRDVTPDATREVIEKEIQGFGELMRYEGGKHTPFAYLSRGIAGIRGSSLIVNVPGSERGAIQSLEALLPIIPHALEAVRGETHECGKKLGETDDPE